MKKIIILFLAVGFLFSCNNEPVSFSISAKQLSLVNADNAFGFKLMKKINSTEDNGKNLFVSPLSVSLALGMTMNGTDGTTLNGIKTTLQLPELSITEINEINKYLLDNLVLLDPKVKLSIANSIWYRQDFSVLSTFIQTNQDYYYAQVSPLDFSNADSKNTINQWVSDNTNAKIPEIIDQINPEDVMFLINAIYFKGNWKYKFSKSDTKDQSFTKTDGGTIEVPTMYQKNDTKFTKTTIYQAIELPYGEGNYSMILMVPNENYTVNDIINEMDNQKWADLLAALTLKEEMNLYIPKFKFEYEIKLNDVLASMGMDEAFSDQANFSKLNPDASLFISEVKHKTFVEVNEEGTEAAAATSVGISFTSVGDNYFYANKPFLCVVKERNTNAIMFIGKIVNPLN